MSTSDLPSKMYDKRSNVSSNGIFIGIFLLLGLLAFILLPQISFLSDRSWRILFIVATALILGRHWIKLATSAISPNDNRGD